MLASNLDSVRKFVVNLSGGKSHFVFLIILINLVLLIEKINGFFESSSYKLLSSELVFYPHKPIWLCMECSFIFVDTPKCGLDTETDILGLWSFTCCYFRTFASSSKCGWPKPTLCILLLKISIRSGWIGFFSLFLL